MPKKQIVNLPQQDLSLDLLKVFEQKDLADMSDEELEQRILKLQELRRIRLPKSKKKTPLDIILDGIDLERARIYLEAFKQQEAQKDAASKGNASKS